MTQIKILNPERLDVPYRGHGVYIADVDSSLVAGMVSAGAASLTLTGTGPTINLSASESDDYIKSFSIKEIGYLSLVDPRLPTAEKFGIGHIWINKTQYWSDGIKYRPAVNTNNARNRLDRASSGQYINFADYSPTLASFTSGAITPAISVRDDLSGVTCTMDGQTASNAHTGLQAVNSVGFWDLSAQHTYPGKSADTVFLLDVEFPELPEGNDVQFSTKISIFFITGSSGSTGFTNNYLLANMLERVAKGRRELLAFKFSDMATAGAPNIAEVKRIEVRVINELSANSDYLEATVRGLYVNTIRKGRLILSFDDGDESFYTQVFKKYIQPKGWGCSAGINSATIGTGTKVSLDMLKELDNSGCEICNHSETHQSAIFTASPAISGSGPWTVTYTETGHGRSQGDILDINGNSAVFLNGSHTISNIVNADSYEVIYTSNPDGMTDTVGGVIIANPGWTDTDITACSSFLTANDISGSNVFIYPGGKNNPALWAQLERLGYVAGRSVRGGSEPENASNTHYGLLKNWDIPVLALGNTDTAASILAELDDILALGADCCIYGHKFVSSPVLSTEFSIAELALLIVGIQARIDSGLCDIPISLGESVINY